MRSSAKVALRIMNFYAPVNTLRNAVATQLASAPNCPYLPRPWSAVRIRNTISMSCFWSGDQTEGFAGGCLIAAMFFCRRQRRWWRCGGNLRRLCERGAYQGSTHATSWRGSEVVETGRPSSGRVLAVHHHQAVVDGVAGQVATSCKSSLRIRLVRWFSAVLTLMFNFSAISRVLCFQQ